MSNLCQRLEPHIPHTTELTEMLHSRVTEGILPCCSPESCFPLMTLKLPLRYWNLQFLQGSQQLTAAAKDIHQKQEKRCNFFLFLTIQSLPGLASQPSQSLLGNHVTKWLEQTICRLKPWRTWEAPAPECRPFKQESLSRQGCQGQKMAWKNNQHSLRAHIQKKVQKNLPASFMMVGLLLVALFIPTTWCVIYSLQIFVISRQNKTVKA